MLSGFLHSSRSEKIILIVSSCLRNKLSKLSFFVKTGTFFFHFTTITRQVIQPIQIVLVSTDVHPCIKVNQFQYLKVVAHKAYTEDN